MAQKVNIVPVDDIDGSEVTETVSVRPRRTSYEIDLNDGNAAAPRRARHLRRPRSAGGLRPAVRGRRRRTTAAASGGRAPREIRGLGARQRSRRPRDRGWVSAEVREAYDKAHIDRRVGMSCRQTNRR